MSENVTPKNNTLMSNFAAIATPENVQKYILGTKKNGNPRAVYDVIKDYTNPKKKKKKHKKGKNKNKAGSSYELYVTTKKKKGKKKKNKHWHI